MLEVDSGEEGQEEEEWGWKERVQLNFLNLIFKREYPQILTLSSFYQWFSKCLLSLG